MEGSDLADQLQHPRLFTELLKIKRSGKGNAEKARWRVRFQQGVRYGAGSAEEAGAEAAATEPGAPGASAQPGAGRAPAALAALAERDAAAPAPNQYKRFTIKVSIEDGPVLPAAPADPGAGLRGPQALAIYD